ELEADRFQNLKYSVQDFKTEAGAVKGEYTKNNSSPYSQLNESTNNEAFSKHTYKHTTMGFFEDIVDMPNQYDYSLEFFNRFYRPEYCTIIVVGDVNQELVNKLSEKYFGNWKRGSFKPEITSEPEQKETRYTNVKVANFPPFLDLNYKAPAFSLESNDYHALSILSQILFSERSALYKKLVVDENKVRELSGGMMPTRDPYLFSASASLVSEKDLAYVKSEIEKAIDKVQTTLVDPVILEETKQRIRYSFAMSMDSPDAIANAVSMYVWVTGNPQSLNTSYQMFDKVSPEDIQRVAKKYLIKKGLTIATISPDDKPVLD
ncbi:MAG TPA: insulinase family protein, partial [Bacteroidia bacterium]|nr:insulinase family protein [Bacteroidia bacterium]